MKTLITKTISIAVIISLCGCADIEKKSASVASGSKAFVFDKNKIVFDSEASVLEIVFEREVWEKRSVVSEFLFFKKVLVPTIECVLKILHVVSYQILEGTQVGPGSDDFFNVLTYDGDQNQIWISTIIAEGIVVKVRDLELFIEETDRVTEEKTHLTVFK